MQKRLKIINEINNIGCLSNVNDDYKYKNIADRLKKNYILIVCVWQDTIAPNYIGL